MGASLRAQCKRHKFDPWVAKIPWRRQWPPAPVLWPGKSHGQISLVGYSPLGQKESDTTEHAPTQLRNDEGWFSV